MPKKALDEADICAAFEQVSGERVAERVDRGALFDSRPLEGMFKDPYGKALFAATISEVLR